MAWVAVAIVGSAAIGAVASGVSALSAAKSSANQTAMQKAQGDANLAFQYEQYYNWQDVYGPIQDNLSTFYQGLSGDSLVASGLKEYETQYQAANDQLQRSFAQRGIDTPAQDFLNMKTDLQTAEFKATLRNEAPLQAAQVKQGFLDKNVQNPSADNISNARTNLANIAGNQATQYANQAAQGYQAAGQAIQGGIRGYTSYQTYQSLTQPTGAKPSLPGYPSN